MTRTKLINQAGSNDGHVHYVRLHSWTGQTRTNPYRGVQMSGMSELGFRLFLSLIAPLLHRSTFGYGQRPVHEEGLLDCDAIMLTEHTALHQGG